MRKRGESGEESRFVDKPRCLAFACLGAAYVIMLYFTANAVPDPSHVLPHRLVLIDLATSRIVIFVTRGNANLGCCVCILISAVAIEH